MSYTEISFTIQSEEDFVKDLLIQSLADIGFDSFEESENGFKAYISQDHFSKKKLEEVIQDHKPAFTFDYTIQEIAATNWNEEWEKNFQPVIIGADCYVRATFHPAQPSFRYEIIIDPKMAFGTGHHETTSQMGAYLLQTEVTGLSVLDMGCGTGILAILAAMKGANPITAIDIDEICVSSTRENASLNKMESMEILLGGAELLEGKKFDIIFANINRNILLADMAAYRKTLTKQGQLFLSGFYTEDLPAITSAAENLNLKYISHTVKNNWVAAAFIVD